MQRLKKFLRYALPVLLLLLVVLYFVGNALLDRASRRAMNILARKGPAHGLEITEPGFRDVRLSGVRSARWTDINTKLRFPQSKSLDPDRLFAVQINQLDAWLTGDGEVSLAARGVEIETSDTSVESDDTTEQDGSSTEEDIAIDFLQLSIPLSVSDPLPGLEQALPELTRLVGSGATELPLSTEGVIEFTLRGEPASVRFRAESAVGGNYLVLEAEDLRPLSQRFDEELTDAEIRLIANYPLRTARLLRIKDDAETTAQKAYDQDDQVPQDAYRHVLWSFLLSKAYGVDFAKQVTDAHEEGDTGNTPQQRDMDYHNNEVGRRYATEKVARKEILPRVLSEPEVRREP